MPSEPLLAGKVAVVTGAGKGIGRAIAEALAAEGAEVAILDRDRDGAAAAAAAIEAGGGRALAVGCDVSEPAQVTAAVERTVADCGGIDVLVNNAGITNTSTLEELTLELWSETIAVDLTGVYLMTQAALPELERRRGKIVNVASQLALRGAPKMSHYCAAKAGVLGFTRACAVELIGRGVHVNAIAPGPTETENLFGVPAETLDAIREELPIKRFATVEEIAPAVVLLASGNGDYFVGATLNVSGGHVM
ncbi:MAG: SDR family oxidoreductase [Actinobacteria bacterium]|nr:SDR family oxidoreductase [Actinomycetota bacterium]